MKKQELIHYAFISIICVMILFVIPFIMLQFDFSLDMLGEGGIFTDKSFLMSVKNTIIFMFPVLILVVKNLDKVKKLIKVQGGGNYE